MAYQWSSGDVRTRQHRAATAPAPSQPPFSPAIPPSLIPGRRTLSATGSGTVTNGLLYSGPDIGSHHPMVKAPGADGTQFYSMNPARYRDMQPPPPPLPLPQSLLPQSIVPPLPPKTPFKVSPTASPTLPPKPPPPFLPLPPAVSRPTVPRSKTQPAPPMPYVASPPQYVPPLVPPKPLGARTPSLPQLNVSPRAKPSLVAKPPPDTKDTAPLTLPSANSSAQGSLGMKEEEELELALELSVRTGREHANSLLSHDEDLARALEQSLLDPAPRPRLRPDPLIIDSEPVPSTSTKPWDARPRNQRPVSHVPSISPLDAQLKEDEALARRLEAEYDGEHTPTPEMIRNVDPNPSESAPLPRYADVVGREAGMCRCSVSSQIS
jgi:hypothetical protein